MVQTILKNIETIIFDLDGTLRYNDPSSDVIFFDLAVEHGIENTEENKHKLIRWAHYYWAKSQELLLDLMTQDTESNHFWVNYTKRQLLLIHDDPAWADTYAPVIQERWEKEYLPEDRLYPDALHVLTCFRNSSYTVGLVSNRDTPIDDYISELGISDYFDFAFVAGQVNSWKPDARIFEAALERAGSKPEQTVYVGDNYYADVLGSQKAGLVPILVDRLGVFHDHDCISISSLSELTDLIPAVTEIG